jgi:hypothetical protein
MQCECGGETKVAHTYKGEDGIRVRARKCDCCSQMLWTSQQPEEVIPAELRQWTDGRPCRAVEPRQKGSRMPRTIEEWEANPEMAYGLKADELRTLARLKGLTGAWMFNKTELLEFLMEGGWQTGLASENHAQ